MIELDVERRLGAFTVKARLEADSSGVIALFGQSGAGKTSLVNMLAGLMRPDRGRIAIDGVVLFDSDRGIDVAPERRRLGYVFQEDRLFPHMSVNANLIYGMRRVKPAQRHVEFDHVVRMLGIGHLLSRRPRDLSGGEKSRVAIGRALLASPRLLLLDEPLASLDAARKNEIMPFIERLRDEARVPIVFVSHVIEEILRLADTLALVSDGRIAAIGPVEALLGRPDLAPLTGQYESGAVIAATVAGGEPDFALTALEFPGGRILVPRLGARDGTAVRLRIRARDVSLALERPKDISILNILQGKVAEIGGVAEGEADAQVDIRLALGAAERPVSLWARITRKSLHDLGIAPGNEVYALIKAVAIDRQSLGLSETEDGDSRQT